MGKILSRQGESHVLTFNDLGIDVKHILFENQLIISQQLAPQSDMKYLLQFLIMDIEHEIINAIYY